MATISTTTELNRHHQQEPPLPLRITWDQDAPHWTGDPVSWTPDGPGWDAWARHLRRRQRPRLPRVLRTSSTSPLLWSAPTGMESEDSPALIAEIARCAADRASASSVEGMLRIWLREGAARPREAGFALESLAWAYALPSIAPAVSAALWWHALEALWQIAREAIEIRLEDSPLSHQLLAGELPYLLGRQFPEIEDLSQLTGAGRAALGDGMLSLLAEEGCPVGAALELWRPLWSCWTRARAWGKKRDAECWHEAAEERYRRLLLQTLRTTRKDGSQALLHGATSIGQPELFAAALSLVGGRVERAVAARAVPAVYHGKKLHPAMLPSPACDSVPSRLAVLRRDWSAGSEMLSVDYRAAAVQVEFQIGRDVLWSGPWTLDLRINQEPLLPQGPWKNVCWMSDKDVDYLELEIPLSGQTVGQVLVQRQMLLARREKFLLLADAVLGQTRRQLEYASRLPLRPGITFTPATETHEGFLTGRKLRANVLPLGLPEWRSARPCGELGWSEDGLQLKQAATGASLYAPLFFDFDPRRLGEPLTWRQVTVAENRTATPQDRAVAYRIQAAGRQWLCYRSLSGKVNRTFLGSNLVSEFLCARFTRKGRIDNLLEVE